MKHHSLALALLVGCPGSTTSTTDVGLTTQPTEAANPCAIAARQRERVTKLRAEGLLSRSLRVLDHADTLCPSRASESIATRAELTTELQSSESAEALIELAQRATSAEAQRNYDRALAAIERAGGRVEVGTIVDAHQSTTLDNLELDRDGGRLAILQGNEVSIRDRRLDYRETHRILREASISTAAFSGDTLAVASENGATTLWSLSSGEQLQTIRTTTWHSQLEFSPDGRTLAASNAMADGLELYDPTNGNTLHRLECTGGFAFMPDGRTIVAVNNNELRAYDVSTGKNQWSVDGGFVMDSAGRVSVSVDGQRVRFAAGYAHIASVDVKSKKRVDLTWESSVPDVPRVLALSPDGELAFLGDSTGPIPGGLHAVTDRTSQDLPVDDGDLETAAFSGDGRTLAFVAGSKVHIVDVSGGRSLAVLESVYARPVDVALSFAGKHLAIAGSDDAARVLSAEGEPALRRLAVGALASIAISADGRELAGARSEPPGEVLLFDAASASKQTHKTGTFGPADVAFSPIDGRVLLSVVPPAAPATPGSRFLEIPIPARTWSRDRSQLALSRPHDAQIVDRTGALVTQLKPREGELRATAFAPSNLLAMGLSNGKVVSTGKLELKAHEHYVSALAFASEERMASAGDGTVKIWDLTDARNQPKIYHLPDVREIEGSAGLFAWTTQDARVHLFHIASNRKATLVAAAGAESAAIHVGDAVELLGTEAATRGLVCRVGQRTYPFALCRERFLTPGLLRAILGGTSLEFPP